MTALSSEAGGTSTIPGPFWTSWTRASWPPTGRTPVPTVWQGSWSVRAARRWRWWWSACWMERPTIQRWMSRSSSTSWIIRTAPSGACSLPAATCGWTRLSLMRKEVGRNMTWRWRTGRSGPCSKGWWMNGWRNIPRLIMGSWKRF